MKNLNIREIRGLLGRLDAVLAEEGEVVVTRHGKPIARVLPLAPKGGIPSRAALRAQMPRQKSASETVVRADRDERG
jgi:prevent-host-death family protein